MILVLGGSGLLGQHLVEALSLQGQKVRASYRHTIPTLYTKPNSANVEWITCNILDIEDIENALQNITEVYHCAAIVSYDPRAKKNMMEVNATGTSNVVNACLEKQIKLCFVSSISTIGKSNTVSDETNRWVKEESFSNYATSKHAAEMEVWRGIAEGLQAVIVNPGIILGEGDPTKSSSNLLPVVFNEFPFYTKGITAWIDVKDLVKAMFYLMRRPIYAERFILSAGNYSYHEIFSKMAHYMQKKPPAIFAGKLLPALVWRWYALKSFMTGKQPTITKETVRSAQAEQHFSNKKFLEANPSFAYTPIEQTLQRICAHYISQKNSA